VLPPPAADLAFGGCRTNIGSGIIDGGRSTFFLPRGKCPPRFTSVFRSGCCAFCFRPTRRLPFGGFFADRCANVVVAGGGCA
jgi:hypothetical protein